LSFLFLISISTERLADKFLRGSGRLNVTIGRSSDESNSRLSACPPRVWISFAVAHSVSIASMAEAFSKSQIAKSLSPPNTRRGAMSTGKKNKCSEYRFPEMSPVAGSACRSQSVTNLWHKQDLSWPDAPFPSSARIPASYKPRIPRCASGRRASRKPRYGTLRR